MPPKRHIDFCAPLEQARLVMRWFDQLGYELNPRFHSVHGNERDHFDDLPPSLSAEVYLDPFSMYHRLDLKPLLAKGLSRLPETQLAMIRLQIVEITEADLSDLCALLLEHNLTPSPENRAVDETQISRWCADDWGWYHPVKMNINRVADKNLAPTVRETLATRVRQIRSSSEVAPKTLRWLARASIGETVRWYETPISASLTARPDRPMG